MSPSKGLISGNDAQSFMNFQYRPLDQDTVYDTAEAGSDVIEPEVRISESALTERLLAEHAAGCAAAEARLRLDFEHKIEAQKNRISKSLEAFEKSKKDYFSRVEAEVVQLALAIARKIIHREAQVDPMLVAAIVHVALGQLQEGSSASIRTRPEHAGRWRQHMTELSPNLPVSVIEDKDLEHGDCVLETELGTVNFSLEAQLKEVERGFFDVLAQKPQA